MDIKKVMDCATLPYLTANFPIDVVKLGVKADEFSKDIVECEDLDTFYVDAIAERIGAEVDKIVIDDVRARVGGSYVIVEVDFSMQGDVMAKVIVRGDDITEEQIIGSEEW